MFVNIESLGWVHAQLGVRKMAQLIDRHIVSRYALSLTPQDREQYHSKLFLANGDCLPDPELLTEWVDNIGKWPDIHWFTEVLPNQRQGKNTSMYQAWVVINKREGYIHTANCTCMAG